MSHPMLRLFDGYDHTSPALRPDVKELQSLLAALKYPVRPDGLFGRGTEAAVMQFQAEHGLLDDGVVGPRTWAMLQGDAPPVADDLPPSTYAREHATLTLHLETAKQYLAAIEAGAASHDLPVALVGGIGSRESGWGTALKPVGPGGSGDYAKRRYPTAYRNGGLPPEGGFGRGLMQIDFDAHEFARTGNWQDPASNIAYGCKVLAQARDYLAGKLGLSGQALLQASLAAYNCGAGNVVKAMQNGHDCDFYTAGRDYGSDTLNRAGFFRMHGW